MSEKTEHTSSRFAKPSGLSLDSWAVIVALVLSGAIWIGIIKHVPW
jgi:hypothetical protein